MQDANDFINFGHNAINNLQMRSDKANNRRSRSGSPHELREAVPPARAISCVDYQLAKLMLITGKIYEQTE